MPLFNSPFRFIDTTKTVWPVWFDIETCILLVLCLLIIEFTRSLTTEEIFATFLLEQDPPFHIKKILTRPFGSLKQKKATQAF